MKDIEEIYTDEGVAAPASDSWKKDKRECLFWSFPHGKGEIQPWRRRLWELQNNSDQE